MDAELTFIHGAMGSRKTAEVLMMKYNYEERGRRVLLLKPQVDERDGTRVIRSRTGFESECELIGKDFNASTLNLFNANDGKRRCDIVLVDEAQFLSVGQVMQLVTIVDEFNVPVTCYGLRTDFQGKMFPGSERLLALADKIMQLDPVCWCGRKAVMNARYQNGNVIKQGEQVLLGGDDKYISLCRKHWFEGRLGPDYHPKQTMTNDENINNEKA